MDEELSEAASAQVETVHYFGDYEIQRELGRGGAGLVYQARQKSLGRPVALKLLNVGIVAAPDLVQRFHQEAKAIARLQHPGIVQIFETGEHLGQPYFSMEFADGGSLADRLKTGTILCAKEASTIVCKMAIAVQFAHERGVLHRDIKPGNILLDIRGEPRLADFGLARIVEQDSDITISNAVLGTPAYMAPEQARGDPRGITTITDVYGLGAVLYHCLTGSPPLGGATREETLRKVIDQEPKRPSDLNPRIDGDLEIITLKCLAKDPNQRYGSARELAEDLGRLLRNEPIRAKRVPLWKRIGLWIRRRPALAAAAALAAIALVIGTIGLFLAWRESSRRERQTDAFVHLQAAALLSGANPAMAGRWNLVLSNLTAARNLDDREYFVDRVVASLEGLDARFVQDRPLDQSLQVLFRDERDGLFVSSAGGVSTWRVSDAEGPVFRPSIPPDGHLIGFPAGTTIQVVRTSNGQLSAWDPLAEREVCPLPLGERGASADLKLLDAAGTRDGKRLAAVLQLDISNEVLISWDLPSGKMSSSVPLRSPSSALALTSDGRFSAVGDQNGQVRVWDLIQGSMVRTVSLSRHAVSSVTFGTEPRRRGHAEAEVGHYLLAVGDEGGSIGVWEMAEGRQIAICRGAHHQVSSLAFSPDGMMLASGGRGPTRLWDFCTGKPLLDLPEGDYVGALDFSENGKWLAVSANHRGPSGRVVVAEIRNGHGITQLRGLASSITKVVLSGDGSLVAALGMAWEVGVWDHRQGKLRHHLEVSRGYMADNAAIALSPSGRWLAYASGDSAQLWDLTSGRLTTSWKLPGGLVDVLAFPAEDTLYLFRMETRQGTERPLSDAPWKTYPRVCSLRNLLGGNPLNPLRRIDEFNVGVISATASFDGRFIAVEGIGEVDGRRHRAVCAIDTHSGETVWRFETPRRWPWGNSYFSPNDARLAFPVDDSQWQEINLNVTPPQLGDRFPSIMGLGTPGFRITEGSTVGAYSGFSVFNEQNRFAAFGIPASPGTLIPQFDRSGRLLAWGAADGVVRVANLLEIEAALAAQAIRRSLRVPQP
ncbi:MAG: protein kinase [Verrucomicrobiales bacterium]|nr:protein kinase [Verrucomicrobiales bacterium]